MAGVFVLLSLAVGYWVIPYWYSGATLLHVDFNGDAQAIWQQPQTTCTWGFQPPDGHHPAIAGD